MWVSNFVWDNEIRLSTGFGNSADESLQFYD